MANPYGNPSDVGSSYNPSTDPNAGFTYTPPPAPTYSSGNPVDVGSSYNPSTDPNAGFSYSAPAQQTSYLGAGSQSSAGGAAPYMQSSAVGGGGGGSSGYPMAPGGADWANLLNPQSAQYAQQSQQWLDFMTGPNGVQFQNQLAQQQEDLQKQIQTASYTGDWNGVRTLQAKLQDVQSQLAKNQADMNNAIAMGNMTGQYNGHATLQLQDISNQMALSARGQDVTMAGIQAQLAQSPLVAWYTARGLPPPQSALMQSLKPWKGIWDVTNQQGPDPLLGGASSPPTPPV